MNDVKFYKTVIWINSLIPLAIIGWDAGNQRLGANPVEYFLRTTGVLTLVFVLITLVVTPLRKLFEWNQLIKYRRVLGLFAFFYGVLHLSTYLIFDRSFDLPGVVNDVIQRPFIALGMAGFIMMVPLAVTSTNKMIKRLGGKRWVRLHKLIYLTAIAGVIHFWMIVKSDVFYPVVFAVVLAVLFAIRAAYLLKVKKPKVAGS